MFARVVWNLTEFRMFFRLHFLIAPLRTRRVLASQLQLTPFEFVCNNRLSVSLKCLPTCVQALGSKTTVAVLFLYDYSQQLQQRSRRSKLSRSARWRHRFRCQTSADVIPLGHATSCVRTHAWATDAYGSVERQAHTEVSPHLLAVYSYIRLPVWKIVKIILIPIL